jgi:5-methylcytosine-specific restriction endonuclease McrA
MNPRLRAARDVHRSKRWAKVRELKLAEQPLCERCKENGRINGKQLQVHHIEHPYDRPDLAYALWNLRVLCIGCHNREHHELRKAQKEAAKHAPPPRSPRVR